MKVTEIVASIREEASGPSYSVPRLCESLSQHGVVVSLHVLATGSEATALDRPYALHAHPALRACGRLGVSPCMRRALHRAARSSDVMHTHGLWMMPNIYPAHAVRGTDCRLVLSPRGTLSPVALRYSRAVKSAAWWLAQRRAAETAACLHATVECEVEDIRKQGLRAPVAVIPNGVDLPDEAPLRNVADSVRRRLLYLGRLHPIKGVDLLLRAWGEVQSRFGDWELHLTGPGQPGYVAELKELSESLKLERIVFTGPAYGAAKRDAYSAAELFVLPTHSENFGMTVAEALAHGVPAVVSQGAPWQGLQTENCGWWIERGEGPLTECLREVMAIGPVELAARGARGRVWMKRDFSWAEVGRMMHGTYEWLLGGGAPPDWVRTGA